MFTDFIDTQLVILLLALPVVYWLGTAAHELGHAAAAKAVGYHTAACGTGTGRVLLRFRLGETVYFVGGRQPTHGVTFSLYPRLIVPRWRAAVNTLGGIAANLVVAAAALAAAQLLSGTSSAVAYLVAAVNGVMGTANLLPLEVAFGGHKIQSDGTQCLRAVRGVVADRMLDAVNGERGLDTLFAELGQNRLRAWFRYHSARVWAVLGATGRARELLAAADEFGPGPTAFERAMAEFCRAFVLDAEKDRAGSAVAIAAARDLFAAAGDIDSQTVCDMIRVEILAEAGDAAGAEAIIAGWERDKLTQAARLVPVVERVRLFARFLLGETAAADELARNAAAEPDPVAVLALLRHTGRVCRDRGDVTRAEPLFRAGCRELPKVAAGFGAVEDLAMFQVVKDELLADYRAAATSAGVALDPDLSAWEATTAEPARATAAEDAARDRRQLRRGVGLVAVKIVVLAALAGAMWYFFVIDPPLPGSEGWATFVVVIAYFSFGAAYCLFPILYLPVALLARWVRPGSFPKAGRTTFGMAVMVWVLTPVMTAAVYLWGPDPGRPQPDRSFFDVNFRPDERPNPWDDPEPGNEP